MGGKGGLCHWSELLIIIIIAKMSANLPSSDWGWAPVPPKDYLLDQLDIAPEPLSGTFACQWEVEDLPDLPENVPEAPPPPPLPIPVYREMDPAALDGMPLSLILLSIWLHSSLSSHKYG